ncbi:MAG: ABC transporter permease [Bergeyella zoohelcum]|nr:ABC transporter permease [Bergeyella zoohelcum]
MVRLLKLEWLKNTGYRPFKVFSIIYFGLLVMLLFIGLVDFELFGNTINLKEQGFYDFPEIWNFTTYVVGLLKIFLGCIIVFGICQEFSNRMFKQNIIDGLSKKEFLVSKMLTILVFSLVSTILVFVITFLLGKNYSVTQETEKIFAEVYFVGNYFVKLCAFFSFLMFLSMLFRKSIFVFLSFFVWWIISGVLSSLEQFLYVGNKIMGESDRETVSELVSHHYIADYLPLGAMSKLIPAPFMRTNFAKALGAEYQFTYPTESLVCCIVWIFVFSYGSYFILKKRDW